MSAFFQIYKMEKKRKEPQEMSIYIFIYVAKLLYYILFKLKTRILT